MNNLKIYIIKKICDKLKTIEMKLLPEDDESIVNSNRSQSNDILCEILSKKSDKNITWEE